MMVEDERRTAGTQRVPVKTLVELCGRDVTGAPAFEAQAIDLSSRGLHVRTAYLPDIGSDLVVRLEDQGREIIAEGRVVWRTAEARGGEFGIMFTALDSGGVAALRELCGEEPALTPDGKQPEDKQEAEALPPKNDPGSRVRLHIDGLAGPMKALVREGATRRLKVGSNLEFLKVGRHLEIENLEQSFRRGAFIDAIDVLVDPQSGVPQLVVAMHYDDVEDTTPEPSVLDSAPAERPSRRSPLPAGVQQSPARHAPDDVAELKHPSEPEVVPFDAPDPADEVVDEANQLRSRFGTAAVSAGRAAKQGGEVLARLSTKAATRVGGLFKDAGQKVIELSRQRKGKQPLRTTSAPPGGGISLDARRLRPQAAGLRDQKADRPTGDGNGKDSAQRKPKVTRRVAAGAALIVLVAGVGALATRRSAPPPGAAAAAAQPSTAVSVAAADIKQVDERGYPVAAAKVERLTAPPPPGSVVADVPLFGPTPMATMEPAPLGPAPDMSAQAAPPAKASETGESADAPPAASDESFEDSPKDSKDGDAKESKEKSKSSAADVKPWGRGTVKTPTIHRLRLDAPGTAIKGEIGSNGFAVFLPGRKVMENPGGIAKRDKRIVKVTSQNTGSGARVSFKFKDGVPGYRVRLRKDLVEFLISAPTGKKSE